MKTEKKWFWVILIAGVLILPATPLLAVGQEGWGEDKPYGKGGWEGKGEWKKHWEAKMEKIHQQLGLTPEQETALREHRRKHRESGAGKREEMRILRSQMRDELQKPQVDVVKVRQLHEQVKQIRVQKEDARLEGILEVRNVLTPEQFQKFMVLKEELKGRHGKGKWKDREMGKPADGDSEDESQSEATGEE